MLISRLAIIGLGLIGGSLARALRRAGEVRHISGFDTDRDNLAQAQVLGVIDHCGTDIADTVKSADVIVVAVPMGAMPEVLTTIAEHAAPNTVISDVGSAKAAVVDVARQVFGATVGRFVPGHPIAGTEKHGVASSRADLFTNHKIVLTPTAITSPRALDLIDAMWQRTGAAVVHMDCLRHDEILAATSHLPHVLAYALVYSLSRGDDQNNLLEYAAGGFADFTRIASSRPEMWRDILFANADAVLAVLERFERDLKQIGEAIRCRDDMALMTCLGKAKDVRDAFTELRSRPESLPAPK